MLSQRSLHVLVLGLSLSSGAFARTDGSDSESTFLRRLLASSKRQDDRIAPEFRRLYTRIVGATLPENIDEENFGALIDRTKNVLHLEVVFLRLYGEAGGGFDGSDNRIATFNRRYQSFITMILLALRLRLQKEPSLEAVVIRAEWVQNSKFAESLSELGFKRVFSPMRFLGAAVATVGGAVGILPMACESATFETLASVPAGFLIGAFGRMLWTRAGVGDFSIRLRRKDLLPNQ